MHAVAVLDGSANAWRATEGRHLADRLGLSPTGLASLGWQLADQTEAPASAPVLVGSLERMRRLHSAKLSADTAS